MLHFVGMLALIAGCVVCVIGGISFLIAAFRESLLWGLAVLFLPFVSLVFLIVHWRVAKDPFFLQLWGAGLILLAALLGVGVPHPH